MHSINRKKKKAFFVVFFVFRSVGWSRMVTPCGEAGWLICFSMSSLVDVKLNIVDLHSSSLIGTKAQVSNVLNSVLIN
jgi:hypothetical protein